MASTVDENDTTVNSGHQSLADGDSAIVGVIAFKPAVAVQENGLDGELSAAIDGELSAAIDGERERESLLSVEPHVQLMLTILERQIAGKAMRFNACDELCVYFSVVVYLADVISDLSVARHHYITGQHVAFYATLALVFLPVIVGTVYCFAQHCREYKYYKSRRKWFVKCALIGCQLVRIANYVEAIRYGYRVRHLKKIVDNLRVSTADTIDIKSDLINSYAFMTFKVQNSTEMAFIDLFLESAPQFALQFLILLKNDCNCETDKVQILSMVVSLIAIAWGLVCYYRYERMQELRKANLTYDAIAVQFIWRLFETFSRALPLVLMASEVALYALIPCAIHLWILIVWRIKSMSNRDLRFYLEVSFDVLFGTIFMVPFYLITVFIKTLFRTSITTYLLFILMENTVVMLFWCVRCDAHVWYYLPSIVSYILSSICFVLFLILYYTKFHPKRENITIGGYFDRFVPTILTQVNHLTLM